MFAKISSKIMYPKWAQGDTRWRRLDLLDRLLEGTFYDHLPYSFYDEVAPNGRHVPLEERRPSSQYRLPRMVARWASRKLWAGRHAPRLRHDDEQAQRAVEQLIQTSRLYQTMMDAAIVGSVGSCAITFRVLSVDGQPPQVALKVWRPKYCTPVFDDFCNLIRLRVHYLVTGEALMGMAEFASMPGAEHVRVGQQYWFVRDYMPGAEVTWGAVRETDWDPVSDRLREGVSFRPWIVVEHGLPFVPAVWVTHMSGGPDASPDGACSWWDAVPMSIEMDYLLSQASRGVRYNCAPSLVVVGEVTNSDEGEIVRSASTYLQVSRSYKTDDGDTFGAGDAKLLEMSGEGIKAAKEHLHALRNMALEMIGASRKDPERVKGTMSARAMEFSEEDAHDMIMELRTTHGSSALELVRKMCRALGMSFDDSKITLNWPKLYQPTSEELAHLIAGLVQAATPIMEPTSPTGVGPNPTSGGRPASKPPVGKSLGALLEVKEASEFLRVNMDLDNIVGTRDAGISDDDRPTPTEPAPDPTEPETDATVVIP